MKMIATITLDLGNAAFQEGVAYNEVRRIVDGVETILADHAQEAIDGFKDPGGKTFKDVNGNTLGSLNIEIEGG